MPLSQETTAALYRWIDVFMFRSMQDLMHFLRKSGLTMAHYSLFMQLYKVGPCGINDVAALLGVTKAAASQMVDKLVKQGVVTRREHETDRRHIRVALTTKGRRQTERCIAARHQWLDDLPPLPPGKQKVVLAGLRELTHIAEGAPATGAIRT